MLLLQVEEHYGEPALPLEEHSGKFFLLLEKHCREPPFPLPVLSAWITIASAGRTQKNAHPPRLSDEVQNKQTASNGARIRTPSAAWAGIGETFSSAGFRCLDSKPERGATAENVRRARARERKRADCRKGSQDSHPERCAGRRRGKGFRVQALGV